MGITYFIQGFQGGVQGRIVLLIIAVVWKDVCRGSIFDACPPENVFFWIMSCGIACGMFLWYLRTAIEVMFGYTVGACICFVAYCVKFKDQLWLSITGDPGADQKIVPGLVGAVAGGGLLAAIVTWYTRKTVWIVGTSFVGAFIIVFAYHLAFGTGVEEGDAYGIGAWWAIGTLVQAYTFIKRGKAADEGEGKGLLESPAGE